jgi:carbonic anhydrase
MSTTDALRNNAAEYAAALDKGDLPMPPARRIAIVACMDARLNPYAILGLQEGGAHVICNAGASRRARSSPARTFAASSTTSTAGSCTR